MSTSGINERESLACGRALFVDFQNVFDTLINPSLQFQRDAALSATIDALNALGRRLREENYSLVVERSYADWG
jgi:hypothetical protein